MPTSKNGFQILNLHSKKHIGYFKNKSTRFFNTYKVKKSLFLFNGSQGEDSHELGTC